MLAVVSPAASGATGAAETEIHAGQPLSEAIEVLRARGLNVIFSSRLVTAGMRVERVPEPGPPQRMLADLLAPHGLDVEQGPRGRLLVVPVRPPGRVHGVVRLAGGGRLPVTARVEVAGGGPATSTDRRGGFDLELPAGSYTLEVRAERHVPRSVTGIRVESRSTTDVVVELAPEVALAESVVVNSPRTDAGIGISRDRLEQTPEVAGDAMRVVSRMPGAAGSDLSARINVHGANDDELLVMLDGLEIYEPFQVRDLGGGFLSLIDRENVGEIDFFRGSFPVRYGNRMGGVLDITSLTPSETARTGVAGQSGLARVSSRGRFGGDRGLWLVSARGGKPGYALPEWVSESIYDPVFVDFLGKMETRVGPHVTISANLLYGNSKSDSSSRRLPSDPAGDETVLATTYGSRYLWVGIRSAWNARLAAETVVSQGEVERDRRVAVADLSSIVHDDRDFEFSGVTQRWTFSAGAHRLQWGAGYEKVRSDYDYRRLAVDFSQQVAARPSGHEIEVYLADTIRVFERLEVELGLRWDTESYSGLGDDQFAPRVNLAWLAGERLVGKLGWGRYQQAQRIYELQVEDGIDRFSRPEASEHINAGFVYTGKRAWTLGVNAYFKEGDSLRPRYENLFDPTGFLPEAQFDRVLVAPDHAQMKGVEIETRAKAGPHVDWWAGYALASAEDQIDGTYVPRTWDQRHAVDAGVAVKLDPGWSLGLVGNYHSGRPTTAVTAQQGDDGIEIVPGPRNRERLPSYLRFDVRGEKTFHSGRHRVSLHGDVLNLLDRENVCCVAGFDTSVVDGEAQARRIDKQALGRVFTVGATWEF